MNRRQLFNDMWKMLRSNSALWIVTFIGLGIGVIANLVLSNFPRNISGSIAISLIDMAISFVTASFVTGAIISMVNVATEGQKLTVNNGFQAGTRRIIPLIFVRLLLMLPIWIIILLFTGSIAAIFTSAFGRPEGIQPGNVIGLVFGGLGTAIVVLFVSILVNMINIGADRAVVLENLAPFAALKRGWQVMRQNLSDFIGIGVYMLIVSLGVGILFSCTIGTLLSSLMMDQLTASQSFNPAALGLSAPVIISTLASLVISVFLEVLFSGVWTLAYLQWQSQKQKAILAPTQI